MFASTFVSNQRYNSLVERSLDLAAGTKVNIEAYDTWGLNLAKLQALGKCYRDNWLHNVLARITPLTIRALDDYLMMADLFINSKSEAQYLLAIYSRHLTAFATAAGVVTTGSNPVVPIQMRNHLALYEKIAALLTAKFQFAAPAPFGSATINREMQAQIPFIREFLSQHFKAA